MPRLKYAKKTGSKLTAEHNVTRKKAPLNPFEEAWAAYNNPDTPERVRKETEQFLRLGTHHLSKRYAKDLIDGVIDPATEEGRDYIKAVSPILKYPLQSVFPAKQELLQVTSKPKIRFAIRDEETLVSVMVALRNAGIREHPFDFYLESDPNAPALKLNAPQHSIFRDNSDEIFVSGGRKSSKTYGILLKLCLISHCKKYQGLVLRKQHKNLEDIRAKLREIKASYFPLMEVNEDKCRFPNGDHIMHLLAAEKEKDAEKFQGWQLDYVYLNEATQFLKTLIEKLRATLVPLAGVPPPSYIFDGNPGGSGRGWIIEMFDNPIASADQKRPAHWTWEISVDVDGITTTKRYARIKSTYRDNEFIDRSAYGASLAGLNGNLKAMWMDDDWSVVESPFFANLKDFIGIAHRNGHEPVYIGIDVGYKCANVCVFGCVLSNGQLYVFDELVVRQTSEAEIFKAIREKFKDHKIKIAKLFIPPDGWKTSAESQTSVAQRYQAAGFAVEKANWDHLTGFLAMQQWMSYANSYVDADDAAKMGFDTTGTPRTIIDGSRCPNLISKLQGAEPDPDNPETILDGSDQDEIDAFRYLCASLPLIA